MFSNAVPIAAGFTRPVVISSRTAQGKCAGTIGAYVVVNRAGWILTAGHLLDIVRAQQDNAWRYAGFRGDVVEFHRDITANKRYRKKGVRTLHQPAGASVRNHSVWWGGGRRAHGRGPGGARGRPRARAPGAVRSRLRRALPGMEGPCAGLRAGPEPVQTRLPSAPHRAGLRREGEHVHLARRLGAPAALSPGRDVHARGQRPRTRERGRGAEPVPRDIDAEPHRTDGRPGLRCECRGVGDPVAHDAPCARLPRAGTGRGGGRGRAPVPQHRARRARGGHPPLPRRRGHRVPRREIDAWVGCRRLAAGVSTGRMRWMSGVRR